MYRGSTTIQCQYKAKTIVSLDKFLSNLVISIYEKKQVNSSQQRHRAASWSRSSEDSPPPPSPRQRIHHHREKSITTSEEFITIERNPSSRQGRVINTGTFHHRALLKRRTQSVIRHQALLRKRTHSIIRHQALPRDTQKTFHRLGKTVAP